MAKQKTWIRKMEDKESFLWFCEDVMQAFNGTWESPSFYHENLNADFELIATKLLVADIVFHGNKGPVAELAGYLGGSISDVLKMAIAENVGGRTMPMTSEDSYIYEVFARVMAKRCVEDNGAREKIISKYRAALPDDYALVEKYVDTFSSSANDMEQTANMLYEIFTRVGSADFGKCDVRPYAILLFMINASMECGHILPYQFLDNLYFTPLDDPLWKSASPVLHETGRIFCHLAVFGKVCDSRDFAAVNNENNISTATPVSDMTVAAREYIGGFVNADHEMPNPLAVSSDLYRKIDVLYSKYLRERYLALANYLGCEAVLNDNETTAHNIAVALWEHGTANDTAKSASFGFVADEFSFRRCYATNLQAAMFEECNEEVISLIEKDILPFYFAARLEDILKDMDESELVKITRRDVIREIGMEHIPADAEFLSNIAYLAVSFEFARMMQQRAVDSIDFLGAKDARSAFLQEKYSAEIKEKDRRIAEQKKEIESLGRVIAEMPKSGMPGKNDRDSSKRLIREISELKNVIAEKDRDIEEAQARTKELLEYIEILEAAEAEDDNAENEGVKVDMSLLRGKRFVFVCCEIDNIYPNLRREFPDSVFVESLSYEPAKGRVDAVVFITRQISHSLYFKTKAEYDGVPMIHFTKKNLDVMYAEMAKTVSDNAI